MTVLRSRKLVQWAAFVVVALLGLALRLPQLGTKPMHTDEAVNAYIVGEVLAGRGFPYDAGDRHGPVLATVAWPLVRVQGAKSFAELTEAELRLTTVLAGTLTVVLFGAGVECFGFVPCLVGAVLMAASSLPVYYDRYFIHESLFVCATFGLILSWWRLWQRGGLGNAAVVGACAAVMLACKETAVIQFAALGVGASKLQTVTHHVLPLAMPGVLTGTIIGLAQALGETAPLLLIGMVAFVKDFPSAPPAGLFDPSSALPVQIYNWTQRGDPGFVERASGAIIVLLVFLILMNSVAIILRRKYERRW